MKHKHAVITSPTLYIGDCVSRSAASEWCGYFAWIKLQLWQPRRQRSLRVTCSAQWVSTNSLYHCGDVSLFSAAARNHVADSDESLNW